MALPGPYLGRGPMSAAGSVTGLPKTSRTIATFAHLNVRTAPRAVLFCLAHWTARDWGASSCGSAFVITGHSEIRRYWLGQPEQPQHARNESDPGHGGDCQHQAVVGLKLQCRDGREEDRKAEWYDQQGLSRFRCP